MTELNDTLIERISIKSINFAKLIMNKNILWTTGIFPSEMAVFLAVLEEFSVKEIVESGRGPDAYSTHILDLYAQDQDARIISLDRFPISERWYSSSLSKSEHLTCETGNAFHLFPKLMRSVSGTSAILIDGPKGYNAINLAAMTSRKYAPKVVALHNIQPSAPWYYAEFCRLYPTAFYLEDLRPLTRDADWLEFRDWERECVLKSAPDAEHGLRDLHETSLIIAIPDAPPKFKDLLGCKVGSKGSWRQHPAFLAIKWLFV